MNPEREILWLAMIFQESKFCKAALIDHRPRCRTDFERLLKAPPKSKEFKKWFNDMVCLGLIEITDDLYERKNCHPRYLANRKKIINYLEDTAPFEIKEVYKSMWHLFNHDRVI